MVTFKRQTGLKNNEKKVNRKHETEYLIILSGTRIAIARFECTVYLGR